MPPAVRSTATKQTATKQPRFSSSQREKPASTIRSASDRLDKRRCTRHRCTARNSKFRQAVLHVVPEVTPFRRTGPISGVSRVHGFANTASTVHAEQAVSVRSIKSFQSFVRVHRTLVSFARNVERKISLGSVDARRHVTRVGTRGDFERVENTIILFSSG